MKTCIILLLSLLLLFACNDSPNSSTDDMNKDILERLLAVENLSVSEISPKNGFPRQFEVYIRQPLDHNNPDGSQFEQRIYISHKNDNSPVLFMPSGYSSTPVKTCELAEPLGANQIYAAHRFMMGARPADLNWQFLTAEQASADFHRVVEVLKTVYNGP